MKRSLFKKLSCYQGSKDIETDLVDPPYVSSDDEIAKVIRSIFTVDEVSGLPKGDLTYYLSPDGNPAVKAWLENNLLKIRSVRGSSVEGLTDDLIEEFSRKQGESVSDYQSRLLSIYDAAVSDIESLNNQNND